MYIKNFISICYRLDRRLNHGEVKTLYFEANNECSSNGNEIAFLEHVEIEVNLEYTRRGVLEMYLIAPSGIYIHTQMQSSILYQQKVFTRIIMKSNDFFEKHQDRLILFLKETGPYRKFSHFELTPYY